MQARRKDGFVAYASALIGKTLAKWKKKSARRSANSRTLQRAIFGPSEPSWCGATTDGLDNLTLEDLLKLVTSVMADLFRLDNFVRRMQNKGRSVPVTIEEHSIGIDLGGVTVGTDVLGCAGELLFVCFLFRPATLVAFLSHH
jgi:hypothetical protein